MPRSAPAARSRRRDDAGFTFIELMVVIAIISMLASIVVVNMDGMSAPTRLRGTARSFGNEIMQLKETASLRGHALFLQIDRQNQRWRVVDPPSVLDVPDPRDREEGTFYGQWESMPPGVQLVDVAFSATDVSHDDTITIEFQPDGEIAPSGFVAFFMHERMKEEDGVSVEVSGLTGLVSYHNGRFQSDEVLKPENM